MPAEEAYSFLFFDSVLSAMIVPVQDPLVLDVMRAFGTYNLQIAIPIALLGAALGYTANWGLGRMLLHCEDRKWIPARSPKFVIIERFIQTYGKWLLLLAPVPVFGHVFTVLCGFFRIPLLLFVTITLVGQGLWLIL